MAVKEKIIVYGGAFDPPHKGHFALIRAALRQISPAALYIVPAFRSPFKDFPAAPCGARAAMLREGLEEAQRHKGARAQRHRGIKAQRRVEIETKVIIHPFEFRRGHATYTWQTVEYFKKLHPDARIYFLMGSDCLGTFSKWKNHRRITACADLLVGRRAGSGLKNPVRARYRLLKGRFPLISSTELRAELFAGLRPRGLLPATFEYINRRGLYLGALRRRLEKKLAPPRFAHTRSVAALAAALALKYGADAHKAALAALLHDTARELSPRQLARFAARNRLRAPRLRETAEKSPVLLHSYAGAHLAARRYGVRDRSVLNAIRQHTLGSVKPDTLSKIIYVADFAAGGRTFPEAAAVRALAFRNLDAAYRRANYVKLVYARKTGEWLHPESARTWNRLKACAKSR